MVKKQQTHYTTNTIKFSVVKYGYSNKLAYINQVFVF